MQGDLSQPPEAHDRTDSGSQRGDLSRTTVDTESRVGQWLASQHEHRQSEPAKDRMELAYKIMQLQHDIFKSCLNHQLTATKLPADLPRILEIGSGLGFWALDAARALPNTQITVLDPQPPKLKCPCPPNLTFAVRDLEAPAEEWPYPPGTTSFIHIRNVAGRIRSWPALFARAHAHLAPGGLLEMVEVRSKIFDFDGDFSRHSVWPEFERTISAVTAQVGRDYDPAPRTPDWLADAGFERVVQRSEILPYGNWATTRELRWRGKQFTRMLNSGGFMVRIGSVFTECGWSTEKQKALFDRLAEESQKPHIRAYATIVFTTARKPLEPESDSE